MIRLPESIHAAIVADIAVAMALRNPALYTAIADIAAEERAMEMKRLLATVPDPSLPSFPSTPEDNPNRFVEDVEGKVFRQEYCDQFVDPPFSVPCPKCTEGHLVDDARGRGGRCPKCSYKTWEQGPVYIGVDHSKGKDHTAVVFSHMEGPARIIDKVITSPAHNEATP